MDDANACLCLKKEKNIMCARFKLDEASGNFGNMAQAFFICPLKMMNMCSARPGCVRWVQNTVPMGGIFYCTCSRLSLDYL
jgi:hypothetical protein